MTGLQAVVEGFVKQSVGSDVASDENVGRAVQFGFSLMQHGDLPSMTADMMVNELGIQASRQFPENRWIAVLVTNAFGGIVRDLYGDYFTGLSNYK